MLDHFIVGDVNRISPEAPVPIVYVKEEILSPGGAGNAASNIAALGGNVFLAGLVGSDTAASQLYHEFKIRKINTDCVMKISGPTTQKIRIIARSQQIAPRVLRLENWGQEAFF
jgi:D-beta-D-heptose 7-phosphate kinase/D-beta-D-heptose 1-phosphate adenosyltransferase